MTSRTRSGDRPASSRAAYFTTVYCLQSPVPVVSAFSGEVHAVGPLPGRAGLMAKLTARLMRPMLSVSSWPAPSLTMAMKRLAAGDAQDAGALRHPATTSLSDCNSSRMRRHVTCNGPGAGFDGRASEGLVGLRGCRGRCAQAEQQHQRGSLHMPHLTPPRSPVLSPPRPCRISRAVCRPRVRPARRAGRADPTSPRRPIRRDD